MGGIEDSPPEKGQSVGTVVDVTACARAQRRDSESEREKFHGFQLPRALEAP